MATGVTIHSYFQFRAGRQFQIASLYLIPFIAAPYTLHAFAALLSRTLLSRIVLVLAVVGFIAFDLVYANNWSSTAKEAAVGNALLWMGEVCISILSCMLIILMGMPDDVSEKRADPASRPDQGVIL